MRTLLTFRTLDAKSHTGWTLGCLGNVTRLQGEFDRAQQLLDEAVTVLHAIGNVRLLSQCLSSSGILAIQRHRFVRGVRLIAASTIYSQVRASLDVDELRDWDQSLASARGHLGDEAYRTAWAEGQAMQLGQAVSYQMAADAAVDIRVDAAAWPLSGRERQVAVLIAHGRANREIAEELVITERTAEAHVTHVLAKLGLRSRAQVAIWVLEHGGFTASGLPGPPAPGH